MYKTLIVVLAIASCTYGAASTKKSNIVRPCHPINHKCVGDNLKVNSKCDNRDLTSVRQKYRYDNFRFEAPFFNASYIDNDLEIQNLNKCYVSEFFFNLASDVAVIAVDCPNLVISSNRTLIQHASAKEDTVYSFSSTWKYPLVRLTANMPNANSMDICSASVFADVTQLPTFIVSPNDKPTKDFLSTDLSFMNIYERETFFYRGSPLFKLFMSSAVCNFGCFE